MDNAELCLRPVQRRLQNMSYTNHFVTDRDTVRRTLVNGKFSAVSPVYHNVIASWDFAAARVRYGFRLVFYSNFVPKTHHF